MSASTAPASCAAIRARISGFKVTSFIGAGGDWIVGSEVPLDEPVQGVRRLARLLAGPIGECLARVPELAPETIPLLLCVAEEMRPGRIEGLGTPLYLELI